jgi:hypothetical protein
VTGLLASDLAHRAVARLLGEGEAGGGLDPRRLPQHLVDGGVRIFRTDCVLDEDAEIRCHAAEVLELEEHAAELKDAIEELQQEMDRGMRRR